MLNEIISNEFIDDRLTKFLNILNGTSDDSPKKPQEQSLSSQLSPVVPADKNGGVSPASQTALKVSPTTKCATTTTQSIISNADVTLRRQRRLLSYFLE